VRSGDIPRKILHFSLRVGAFASFKLTTINNMHDYWVELRATGITMKLWTVVLLLISAVFLMSGALFFFGAFIPMAKHIRQDLWVTEKTDSEPPNAYLMFTFTSKGGFTANYPIHVEIQIWLTAGINYSDLAIVFPDAYEYPRKQMLGKPPEAPWIPISENGDRIGESDMEFTSPGSFGYIIYSQEKPVYYAADQQIIQISPYEVRVQTELNYRMLGVALVGVGLSTILVPEIKRKSKPKITGKKRRKKRKKHRSAGSRYKS
jgi:hypothetical protein